LEICTEKAEFTHHGDKFPREAFGAKALLDDGDEIILNEVTRGAPYKPFVFAEGFIQM
jgi:hypothetical protein